MTRLVKLLYLLELEYYRSKRERLTGLDWKFLHYGPYPPSLKSVLGGLEIESFQRKGGKNSQQFVIEEERFMEASADEEIESLIAHIVKQWGDADLNQLLDFVYFETEPMQKAKRGEVLDFSGVKANERARVELRLDAIKLNQARARLSERARAYSALRRPLVPPSGLPQNLEIWDADRAKQVSPGPCIIRVEDLVPKE